MLERLTAMPPSQRMTGPKGNEKMLLLPIQ
jgi:hypothetical protein